MISTAIVPQIIEAPGRGLVTHIDPRHVPEQSWANGRNVLFPTGATRVCKTDGFMRVDGTVPAEEVKALWWYVEPTGARTPTLVRIGQTGIWEGLGSARNLLYAFPTALTADDVTVIDQYKEKLILADGKQVTVWTGAESPRPITAGAPTAKLVEIHKEHVLLGNLTAPIAQPWRVAYSVVGLSTEGTLTVPAKPEDFTGETAGDVDFLEDSTPITCLKVMGDHCVVHKPNRIYRMVFVGSPDEYIVEGVAADEGAISARGAISIGSFQYYMGRTNFYRLGSFSEPIGDAIWSEVAKYIDWPRAHLVYAYRRLEWDSMCWKIPTRGSDQPNLTAVFNYRDQTWTLTDHDPGTCFSEVPSDALPSTAYDDAASPISPPPVRGCFGQVNGNIQVYGGRNADGVAIWSWLESRHFQAGLTPVKILAVPIFATGTGALLVALRAAMDARQPLPEWPVPRPYLVLDPKGYRPWIDVRAYGRLWQIRLETMERDTDWVVNAYGAAIIPGAYAR